MISSTVFSSICICSFKIELLKPVYFHSFFKRPYFVSSEMSRNHLSISFLFFGNNADWRTFRINTWSKYVLPLPIDRGGQRTRKGSLKNQKLLQSSLKEQERSWRTSLRKWPPLPIDTFNRWTKFCFKIFQKFYNIS